MVKYVSDEVDRLKGLFQEREDCLTLERDKAIEGCSAAAKECKTAMEDLQKCQAKAASLAAELEVTHKQSKAR